MPSPHMTITVNSEVNDLHQQGLTHAHQGKYREALGLLVQAREALDPASHKAQSAEELSCVVQGLRIARDEAFVHAKIGLQSNSPTKVVHAYENMERHIHDMQKVVQFALRRKKLTTGDQTYLAAEQGASTGIAGRLATAIAVTTGDTAKADQASELYERTNDLLRSGGNHYYLASNAANAARHERLFGSNRQVITWLGRAALHVAGAACKDRPNFKPALRTVVARVPSLITKRAAAASVPSRP